MRSIVVERYGGADVLRVKDVPVPTPKPNEALVKLLAIGVNFIDVYHRTGLYPIPLPHAIGQEGAGVVEAVGAEVSEVRVGDRVAFAGALGAYSEYHVVSAEKLVKLPDALSFEQGAAAMLQGMTAHYLAFAMRPIARGDVALVHAAAGGVGLLLVQLLKRLGARVIGVVSTEAKAKLAKEAGADDVIVATQSDFEAETKRLTDGKGVQIVFDSVGKDTWEKSLNSLAPRGMMVSYGNASGAVPPFSPLLLSQKGSIFLARPALHHFTATREELLTRAGDVFRWIESGELKLRIEHRFALDEARQAHEALEGRKTTGKILLIP
ncbi:MAG: quinone oxidoreductase [Chloroherpetonaceae bacterium]|nr:quinone oxidoreductase [Chloroherpetonaceae bacterium]